VLSWNYQGFGNPRIVQDLSHLVRVKKPNLVFLMETKLRHNKIEGIRIKTGFQNLFVVDCVGKSMGLALLWNKETDVTIQNFSQRRIHAAVWVDGDGVIWRFNGFYGHPNASKRHEAWNLLRFFAAGESELWMCAGDINEIVDITEKCEGGGQASGLMNTFKNTLDFCGLLDLGAYGPKFTWQNGQKGESSVQERLDRVVAKSSWCERFLAIGVYVEATLASNHAPLWILLEDKSFTRRGRAPFRYEAQWGREEECKAVVKLVWREKKTFQR
jgi:hypothetical protein